jgi:hypothetical protein
MKPASIDTPSKPMRVIGRGTCGTIYTSASPSTVAYKVGRDKDALWNDIQLTARVHGSFEEAKTAVDDERNVSLPRVPGIKGWMNRIEHAGLLEGGVPADSLIPTTPRESRQALLSRFNFTASKAEVLTDPENDFCLIRPYLGLASRVGEALCRADNLWNFSLTLEDSLTFDLGEDVRELARKMARGLATIHWHAGIDGMDIEFVLGEAHGWDNAQMELTDMKDDEPFLTPTADHLTLDVQSPFQHTMPAPNARRTQLYVLDFDKAFRLSFDRPDVAIRRLATAVTCNDPYSPNPAAENKNEKQLWETFKRAYLRAAHTMSDGLARQYGEQARWWPETFLREWEEKAMEPAEGRDGSFIEFGH